MSEYCLRCGLPHDCYCLRTVAERLDAAENGDQFGRVLNSLFSVRRFGLSVYDMPALEHAIDQDDQ